MTNQALCAVLTHLLTLARDAMSGNPDRAAGLEIDPSALLNGPAESARLEKLLRVIDDLHELISDSRLETTCSDRFDPAQMVSEVSHILNLVTAGRNRSFLSSGPPLTCSLVQNRTALDYALMRLLTAVLEVSVAGNIQVLVEPSPTLPGARISLRLESAQSAESFLHWLTVDVNQAAFPDQQDVAAAVAVMVAGRRFRLLKCRFGATHDVDGSRLIIDVPSLQSAHSLDDASHRNWPASLSVLVVEDFDESFHLTFLALEEESVHRARNGWEALGLIRQHRFDLILMDIHMPGLDGYSTIRAIREWETETGKARTPIIILSTDDIATQKHAAAQAGCSGFLRKPVCNEEIREIIARVKLTQAPSPAPLDPSAYQIQ